MKFCQSNPLDWHFSIPLMSIQETLSTEECFLMYDNLLYKNLKLGFEIHYNFLCLIKTLLSCLQAIPEMGFHTNI